MTLWYASGTYTRLIELAEEGKLYLSVLYNVGLIAFLAVILGFLMNKISDVIGHEKHIAGNPDDSDKADTQQ